MALTLGEQLQDALRLSYDIEREIGRGASAVVYLAQDVKHGRRVALKVLHPELSAGLGAERFLREIRIAARLTHPHILPLYDSGHANGWLYYVMPYVDGESLRARLIREGQLPVEDAIRITSRVAGALAYAHRLGVVHRDIKPENILLHEGEALVADFGLAWALGEAGGDRLTGSGLALGTPAYMSPEQASGELDVDHRSDVFSLGCVVFEMLAGQPPFTGRTTQAIIARRFFATALPLRDVRAAVPEAVDLAVAKALDRIPNDRFATIGDFAHALTGGVDMRTPTQVRPVVLPARDASSSTRAVAVLPFADMSAGRDSEYFGDGMAEEVINALAYLPGLRVASRTSAFAFKDKTEDIRRIGQQLAVDVVLEGSVRKSGDKLRITAQLIDVATGYRVWSQRYDRDLGDVFMIQDELARSIVGALTPELLGGRNDGDLVKRYTDNLAAYDLYLRGRYHLNNITAGGLSQAIECFEQAISEDPLQAPAHAALASACVAYAFFGEGSFRPPALWRRGRDAARAALAIDPALADALGALGTTKWACDWDFAGAERDIRRAVELKPGDASLHNWHGWALLILGRFDESLRALARARDLDPLSPWMHRSVSRALYFDRQHDRAIEECRRAIGWAPKYYILYADLAATYIAQGRMTDALTALEQGLDVRADDERILSLLGVVHARLGERAAAEEYLEALMQHAARRYVTPVDIATVRFEIGDVDGAVADLEAAYEARDAWLPWLKWLPLADEMREERRIGALVERMR